MEPVEHHLESCSWSASRYWLFFIAYYLIGAEQWTGLSGANFNCKL